MEVTYKDTTEEIDDTLARKFERIAGPNGPVSDDTQRAMLAVCGKDPTKVRGLNIWLQICRQMPLKDVQMSIRSSCDPDTNKKLSQASVDIRNRQNPLRNTRKTRVMHQR